MTWLSILPFRRFELTTRLSAHEARAKLQQHVGGAWRIAPLGVGAPYAGMVDAEGFELRRNVQARNMIVPRVQGSFRSARNGAVIDVRITLPPLVYGLVLTWLLGAGAVFGAIGFAIFVTGQPGGLLALLLPVLGALLVSAVFAFEASKAERFLRELFLPFVAVGDPYRAGQAANG